MKKTATAMDNALFPGALARTGGTETHATSEIVRTVSVTLTSTLWRSNTARTAARTASATWRPKSVLVMTRRDSPPATMARTAPSGDASITVATSQEKDLLLSVFKTFHLHTAGASRRIREGEMIAQLFFVLTIVQDMEIVMKMEFANVKKITSERIAVSLFFRSCRMRQN